jgi:NADH:ubiquinone oxidoreductase subunit 5 (subunit L)/multisubunit Na+/H+ antiporter MnhA subunit
MPKKYILNSHESNIVMSLPLFLLSIGGLFIGYLSKDIFIGVGINS